MEGLIKKYQDKLIDSGLCDAGSPIIGGLDAELVWNRKSKEVLILEKIINGLNINSILFSKPAEPYFSILNFLAKRSKNSDNTIYPQDCETRTFLHDIPVTDDFEPSRIINHLKYSKAVIIPDHGIVTFGIVSPEQAFIIYSSVCFSLYVKFFVDYYYDKQYGRDETEQKQLIDKILALYSGFLKSIPKKPEGTGPFKDNKSVFQAMVEAGRMMVDSRMVDSFFGNISYNFNDTIFISQTGSSLDELNGYIDACPVDNSSSVAITASSEFSAHKRIYELTGKKAILHGHPKFSVIMSMICDEADCKDRDKCHIKCRKERAVNDIPIVPGEVGTGPTGLCNTLPQALNGRGAIVYGHGLFTTGKNDFTDAYKNLVDIEKMCFEEYGKLV